MDKAKIILVESDNVYTSDFAVKKIEAMCDAECTMSIVYVWPFDCCESPDWHNAMYRNDYIIIKKVNPSPRFPIPVWLKILVEAENMVF